MSILRQNSDGSWSPAQPEAIAPGIDYEVERTTGGYLWTAYIGDVAVDTGTARTRLGLAFALRWHRWASGGDR